MNLERSEDECCEVKQWISQSYNLLFMRIHKGQQYNLARETRYGSKI